MWIGRERSVSGDFQFERDAHWKYFDGIRANLRKWR